MNLKIFGCLISKAMLWSTLLFSHNVIAAICERHLGAAQGLTRAQQVFVLQDLAGQGCELIAVRFLERSNRTGLMYSHVVLDLANEQLVRSITFGSQRRYYAWTGVGRDRLMQTDAAVGFQNFDFVGRASRHRMSPGVRDLLP